LNFLTRPGSEAPGWASLPALSASSPLREFPRYHHYGGEHILDDRVGVGVGNVGDKDVTFICRSKVDVVVADTVAADYPEILARLQDLAGEQAGADDDAEHVFFDQFREGIGVCRGRHGDLQAGFFQYLHSRFVDRFDQQHFCHDHFISLSRLGIKI
jgi:hypothetical protein